MHVRIVTCIFCGSILILPPAGDMVVTDEAGEMSVYNLGDIAWTLTCTALVWIMIPGLGFLYSGLLRRKNALSQIYLSVTVLAVVSFQVRIFGVWRAHGSSHDLVVFLGILFGVQRNGKCLHWRSQ